MKKVIRTLEEQREEFAQRKFLATPLSGLIAWLIVGLSGLVMSDAVTIWVLFITTGSIVYLALFVSRFTGENFLDKNKPKNEFDRLFFFSVGQAVLVYSIAIPFFLVDYTSLPMSIGILTGLMWLPFSWIIRHWIGIFHAVTRTIIVVLFWYLFPEQRFIVIPFSIAFLYIVTIIVLLNRNKAYKTG